MNPHARPGTAGKIVIVGQGYVGLPLAYAAWDNGYDVIGYDTDDTRVQVLAAGESPIDDLTDAQLREMLISGRYRPSSDPQDLAGFAVAVITVPTPLRDGKPFHGHVVTAAHTVALHLTEGALVVLESTVAPGTTRNLLRPLLDAINPGKLNAYDGGYRLAFSPERIDPGNKQWTITNTPKLVAGLNPDSATVAVAFYSFFCREVVHVQSPEAAEMAKLLENTYRHVNIALVNELARGAHAMGIDVWDVIRAAATKPYGFHPFYPGPGVGGHCLPVDPVFLADRVEDSLGRPFAFVNLAVEVNRAQPGYVAERVLRLLNSAGVAPSTARVLVLGAAYKANSGDVRETPATDVINHLGGWGVTVHVSDPHADVDTYVSQWGEEGDHSGIAEVAAYTGTTPGSRGYFDPASIGAYDLVLLLTDHDDFPYDTIAREAKRIFDTRDRFGDAHNVEKL